MEAAAEAVPLCGCHSLSAATISQQLQHRGLLQAGGTLVPTPCPLLRRERLPVGGTGEMQRPNAKIIPLTTVSLNTNP